MPKVFLRIRNWFILAGCFFACFFFSGSGNAQQREKYLERPAVNKISQNWFYYSAEKKQLLPFVPGYRQGEGLALYQRVLIEPSQPFQVSFSAIKNLSVFLDNKLVFVADSTADYVLDLSRFVNAKTPRETLLAVWHPEVLPTVATFINVADKEKAPEADGTVLINKPKPDNNLNPFIIGLLLIGLLYGGLRTSFSADFSSLFRLSNFFRSSALHEGFLARPVGSWSSIVFILAFSFTFALVIVAIHTNIQNIVIFNRFLPVSESDIVSKIGLYTVLIFCFMLLKLVFLQFMAYVFDLLPLVMLQYREFIRTLLFLGLFLPVVLLGYLNFNTTKPGGVLLFSNIAVSLMLIFTTFRVVKAVNNKASLLNLHLFSYICATELIPLAIILKWVVFNF